MSEVASKAKFEIVLRACWLTLILFDSGVVITVCAMEVVREA